MKLSPRDFARLVAKPDPALSGVLIYGQDAMRVALKRQELIAATIGPQGEGEMRLDRMAGAELRRDAAQLLDAVKAQGFFPGPRVVFLDSVTDQGAEAVQAALSEWRPGDAQIVATAGALKASSKLRKLFEGAKAAGAVAIYDDPPTQQEIEAELTRAGLSDISPDAMRDLTALSRLLDPGDFRQTLQKIALYKHGDATPLTPAEVADLAPASHEAAVDDLLHGRGRGRIGQDWSADGAAARPRGGSGHAGHYGHAPFPQPARHELRSRRPFGGYSTHEAAHFRPHAATVCCGRPKAGGWCAARPRLPR